MFPFPFRPAGRKYGLNVKTEQQLLLNPVRHCLHLYTMEPPVATNSPRSLTGFPRYPKFLIQNTIFRTSMQAASSLAKVFRFR